MNFAFGGFISVPGDQEESQRRTEWVQDEFEKLRYSYYV
jgi:hypothetical protein